MTLMVMTAELDAGPIVARWPVAAERAARPRPSWSRPSATWPPTSCPPELDRWAAGPLETEPQDPRAATYVHPFTRADGWIDWRRPAVEIDRQVRALQPWPGAWTTVDGRRIHLRRARPVVGVDGIPIGALFAGETPIVACGVGGLMLEIVQPEGRATMPADAWRRGLGRDHVLLGAGRPEEVAR